MTRRARAFGREIDPPVLREDRWVVVDREWWLHPLSVAPGCDEPRDEIERTPLPNRYEATTPSTFERPLPAGATVGARSANDRSIEVTLTKALRGGSLPLPAPPSPEGYEHIYVEVRVESTDGSQLGSALTFRSATVDGWFLRETGPSMTTICPGTEDTGVTCHLFAGLVLVAEDDPAPRLAWIQRPSHERIAEIAWWWLPTIERDGAPVVRDLPDAELTRALDAAGIVQDVWRTDFSRAAIDYAEVFARSASRSVLGALTLPQYETVEEAAERMAPNEPVIALEVSGEARAYPLEHPALEQHRERLAGRSAGARGVRAALQRSRYVRASCRGCRADLPCYRRPSIRQPHHVRRCDGVVVAAGNGRGHRRQSCRAEPASDSGRCDVLARFQSRLPGRLSPVDRLK